MKTKKKKIPLFEDLKFNVVCYSEPLAEMEDCIGDPDVLAAVSIEVDNGNFYQWCYVEVIVSHDDIVGEYKNGALSFDDEFDMLTSLEVCQMKNFAYEDLVRKLKNN